MKLIAQGAEAKIFLEDNKIIKERVIKAYRHKELDRKIRLYRVRREAKILKKCKDIINVPKVINVDEKTTTLEQEFIDGKKIAECLESLPKKQQKEVAKQIGKQLAILHNNHIIHGDLTTSNMILKDKVYFIDFGLGFIDDKVEHKAVDLHLLEQAFDAKHHTIAEEMLQTIFKEYESTEEQAEDIFLQLDKVRKRGRYKKR